MPIVASLTLCSAAQEVEGLLFVLGGGWNRSATADLPNSMALAMLFDIPLDETDEEHSVEVRLTANGEQVSVGGTPVVARDNIPPADVPLDPGLKTDLPLTISWHGIVLPQGLYTWELLVDDEQIATAPFLVEPPGEA